MESRTQKPLASHPSAALLSWIDELLSRAPASDHYLHNCLLDLRTLLQKRSHAGACVECFFKVYEGWKQQEPAALQRLRSALAALLEIVGRDAEQREQVKLPARLNGDNLEHYCMRILREVQQRQQELGPICSLEFRFRAA